MLKPLLPNFNPAHLEWEDKVTISIEERFEVCRSDAQAIVEVQSETMEAGWRYRWDPDRTADAVMRAAEPKPAQAPSR